MDGSNPDTRHRAGRSRVGPVRQARLLQALLFVGTLVLGVLVTGLPAGAAPARAVVDPEATPLSVALTSMTPSQIPRKGVIKLTGVVANGSGEDWTDVNVAPFVSTRPITTRDDLALAAATAPSVAVGERLTDPGTYAAVGDLAPGASAAFSIRIPVTSTLTAGGPGVYWIGVHALGTNAEGRDLVADGRARTFIPLVTTGVAGRRSVPVSIVLPLRERARRAADGSLNGPTRWVNLTKADGRLSRLVAFGSSAGPSALTWVLDPAVLDALDDFGHGNVPLSLGSATRTESGEKSKNPADGAPEESPGGGPTGEPSAPPSPGTAATPAAGDPSEAERTRASGVLQEFLATARGHTLLTVGYGDPDVVSLARRRPSLLRRAGDLTTRRMAARDLRGTPVVAPPDGYFDPRLLAKVPRDSLLLLTDRGRLQDPPLSMLPTGQELVLTDERSANGGPAPTRALDPLALRQRILAEAALELSRGGEVPRAIVVTIPPGWDPGPRWRQADFFRGLATPWLRLTSVPRGATRPYVGSLAYGKAQLAEEIGTPNVQATRALTHTSGVLGDLLDNTNDVTDRLAGAALQASAYSARATRKLAAEQVLALDASTRALTDRVRVTGTDFVTLSGGSGSLTVTLVNGLKQPITVGLDARADSPDVKVETPDPVSMQPGERTTLRLQVTSGVGVHDVTLYPVTAQGQETGTPLTFSLRTSQVGQLIWYIIIAGGTLLAVMVLRRIVLRIRNHRWRESEVQ